MSKIALGLLVAAFAGYNGHMWLAGIAAGIGWGVALISEWRDESIRCKRRGLSKAEIRAYYGQQ